MNLRESVLEGEKESCPRNIREVRMEFWRHFLGLLVATALFPALLDIFVFQLCPCYCFNFTFHLGPDCRF